MRKLFSLALFAALLGGFFTPANAQGVGQLGSGQVWGNSGASQTLAAPTNVSPLIDRAIGSTSGTFLQRSASAWVANALNGDCTATNTAAIVCLKTNGVPFGSASAVNVPISLTNGGLGGSQAAATANQIPVFPGSSGAAVPTSASTWFDSVCSSTIGQGWVRLTGGWGCTSAGYANPVWWGADPTGSADSATAFNSALAASNVIKFPAGTFKLNSRITYTLPNALASVTVECAGQDVTILTWPNATGGIKFAYQNLSNTVHVKDCSLTTGQAGGGTAILLDGTALVTGSTTKAQTDIVRVTLAGADGYGVTDWWTIGVDINSISYVNITTLFMNGHGGSSYTTDGTGISSHSPTTTPVPVVINVTGSNFNLVGNGFTYGANTQGVTINQTNFTGGTYGVLVPGSLTGLLQLAVTDSQFNVATAALNLGSAIGYIQANNNLFLVPNSGIGLSIGVANNFVSITNNGFNCNVTGTNGIVIANALTGNVSDNVFASCGTSIWTQSSESGGNFIGNSFIAGSTGYFLQGSNANIAYNAFNSTTTPFTITGAGNRTIGNFGYNPVGATAAANVPASPGTVCAGTSPETHYLKQTATNTATVTQGGQQILALIGATTLYPIDLGPNECYIVTWVTTNPTVTKFVH